MLPLSGFYILYARLDTYFTVEEIMFCAIVLLLLFVLLVD